MIKISVSGAKEIAERFLSTAKKSDAFIGDVIGQQARASANAAQAAAPKKTGKLAQGIKAEEIGPMTWIVRSNVDYFGFQAYGTQRKNYPIYPRNKKALYWAGLEHPIAYVRSHPGIRAKPFGWLPLRLAQQNIGAMASKIANFFKSGVGS